MPPILLAVLVAAVGYFGYTKYQESKTKTVTTPSWLPPIPALTKTYNDYRTVQLPLDMTPIIAWSLTTNQPVQVGPGSSGTVSDIENHDAGFGPGSPLTGGIFWMNVNGVANRIYTPINL